MRHIDLGKALEDQVVTQVTSNITDNAYGIGRVSGEGGERLTTHKNGYQGRGRPPVGVAAGSWKGKPFESVDERRARVWALRLEGWRNNMIAEALGVDMGTVAKDLQASGRAAREHVAGLASSWLEIQVQRQEDIRRKAFELYRSCPAKQVGNKIACLRAMIQADNQVSVLLGLIGSGQSVHAGDREPGKLTGDREAILAALADRLLETMASMPSDTRKALASKLLKPSKDPGPTSKDPTGAQ